MRKAQIILVSLVFVLIGLEFVYLAWHFKRPWPVLELLVIVTVYAATFYSLRNPRAQKVRLVRAMGRRKARQTWSLLSGAVARPLRGLRLAQSSGQ
jgi:hypothetical protein